MRGGGTVLDVPMSICPLCGIDRRTEISHDHDSGRKSLYEHAISTMTGIPLVRTYHRKEVWRTQQGEARERVEPTPTPFVFAEHTLRATFSRVRCLW